MVSRKDLDKKFALISVYNKNKLGYLCRNLKKNNFNFISTGSTGNKIRKLGYKCIDIFNITNSKEMFDGRVKTLNPLIYSSILYIRDNEKHKKQFQLLKIPKIDIVVVNLYPFQKYLEINNKEKVIEMIDIGGPSLIRAASKNFKYITSIADVDDYKKLINNLDKNEGVTDIYFRKKMAAKTFKITSLYDNKIYTWLNDKKK
tara:strand:- start:54 stop:659 length:606 start_codon:yes stop_codon:yes gene_type:complete